MNWFMEQQPQVCVFVKIQEFLRGKQSLFLKWWLNLNLMCTVAFLIRLFLCTNILNVCFIFSLSTFSRFVEAGFDVF